MYRYLLVLISLVFFNNAFSQQVPAFVYYNNLTKQTGFPTDLQSSRSAVIVNVNEDWKEFSANVHGKLRLMSIDAIQYIDYNDLNAGNDATLPILDYLKLREVENILTFSKNSIGQYEVNITGAQKFLQAGQHKSASFANVELEDLLKYMANELIKAELLKNNFLIADKPELLSDIDALKGRKFEVHARDVATQKLAVPRFKKIAQAVIDASTEKESLVSFNQQVDRMNIELSEIMKEFPYKYELVDDLDSKELYRKGFQFALFHLDTRGVTIKKMMNMTVDDAETEYISSGINNALKRINVEELVTKYYIKQVYTNDVYTGDKWDADITWQKSLKNFLFNYRKFVKR